MIKEELIKVLEEGIQKNRIDQKQYDTAINLFHTIYEEKAEDESSEAHAELCTIINTATAYDPKSMSSEDSVEVVEAELRAAQEFINSHPVLKYSPGDLERDGVDVEAYLKTYDESTQELYREYYDLE